VSVGRSERGGDPGKPDKEHEGLESLGALTDVELRKMAVEAAEALANGELAEIPPLPSPEKVAAEKTGRVVRARDMLRAALWGRPAGELAPAQAAAVSETAAGDRYTVRPAAPEAVLGSLPAV